MSDSTSPCKFEILARDSASQARCGRLWTAHGPVDTPVFMPVGTQAAVKAMTPAELQEADVKMILANTYHLHVRPGEDIVAECGGLHRFMGWDAPILTDSGGFQVFSLASLRKIREDGVEFNSHVDGRRLFLGPKESMVIQARLERILPWRLTSVRLIHAIMNTLAMLLNELYNGQPYVAKRRVRHGRRFLALCKVVCLPTYGGDAQPGWWNWVLMVTRSAG